MIPAATLRANVEVKGVPKGSAELRRFHASLKEVSGASATAELQANFKSRGFDEFALKVDRTRAKASKAITQEVKVDYDQSGFSRVLTDMKRVKQAVAGGGGTKGLGPAIGEAFMPFGKIPSLVAIASPALLDFAGAAGAVASSAAEAGAGVGALAIGGAGAASVGIAGIAAVAVPAITSLKNLKKAQDAYIVSVETYGVQSTQAESAAKKLRAAESMSGKGAISLVRHLDSVKERWSSLTKSGQKNFLGMLDDGLDRVLGKLPLFAKSADSSTAALREGFDGFLKQVMGPGFNHFVDTMTVTFANVIPRISHAFGDWTQILMRLAVAAAPSLERVVGMFERWSDKMLASTGNAQSLRQGVSGLVDQTLSWVHLLTATGNLLLAVFGDGAGQGQRLVDDLTGKMKEWTGWIKGHGPEVREFFTRSADAMRELGAILAGSLQQWAQIAIAMHPIEMAVLGITKALNSIKIGNVSALTALLVAYVGARGVSKVGHAIEGISALASTAPPVTTFSKPGWVAQSGGLAASGTGMAAPLMAGLSRALPFAAAAVGLGDILVSATKGDWEGAGFKAGGALAGGIAGALVGGPAGAAIGAGLGSVLGGIVGDLTHGGNGLTRLQQTIHNQAQHATDALLQQRGATRSLAAAQDNLVAANHRHAQSTQAVKRAHDGLNAAIRKFGPDSAQARHAEITLSEAQHRDALTAHEAEQAHKLSGNALKLYRHETVLAVAAEKERLPALSSQIQHLSRKYHADQDNYALLKRLVGKESQVAQIRHTITETVAAAEDTASKKFADRLRSMTSEQAAFGKHFSGIGKAAQSTKQKLEEFAQGGGAAIGRFGTVATSNTQIFKEDAKSISAATGIAASKIETRLANALEKVGVSAVDFRPKGKQTGGFVVPGTGEGDSFHTHLPPGSFVMNKKATAAFGFQNGGHVPVMLEPTERVFMPPEVAQYGRGTLETANNLVPRFAKGGSIGKEPHLGGPDGQFRALGQGAVHGIYGAAQKYFAAHMPKAGPAGMFSGPTPAGVGFFQGFPVDKWIIPELLYAVAHGWKGAITSGFRTEQHSAELGYPHDEHTKTSYPGGAVDFGGMTDPAGAANRAAFIAATKGYKGPRLLLPIGFHDDGHMSGTGHMLGGFVRKMSVGGSVPPSSGELVGASYYGGPSDGTSGTVGSSGVSLPGKMAFAELAMGKALGGLPYHTKLAISRAGKSVIAEKLDIGAGGGDVGGKNRAIDLWYETAQAIGMPGTAVVRVAPSGGGSGSTAAEKLPPKSAYHFQGGATSAGGGTFAPGKGHVYTAKLDSFGSPPSSLEGCRKELSRRRTEIARYRKALGEEKDPQAQAAIKVNIKLLSARIQQLLRQQSRLIRKAHREKVAARIEGRGQFPTVVAALKQKEDAYAQAEQFAQQVVTLEPENANAAYIGQESAAYGSVLGAERNWRNAILGAESTATARIKGLDDQVASIEGLQGKHPNAFKKQKYRIPALKKAIAEARQLYDPKTKSGSWEEALTNVQGIGGSHESLASLPSTPVAGAFGGLIFETQNAIRELGLKVSGGGEAATEASPTDALLEQLLTQANQRTLVAEKQFGTLTQFQDTYPPGFAGMFAKGGSIPAGMWGIAGERGPEPIMGPTTVVSNPDAQRMFGGRSGDVQVIVNGSIHQEPGDTRDPVEVILGDRRFAPAVQQAARAGRGIGRATPGGR